MGWDCDFGATGCTGKKPHNVLYQLRAAMRERCIVSGGGGGSIYPPRANIGAWSAGTYYWGHDVVEYGGIEYTAKTGVFDNQGKNPVTETSYWVVTTVEDEVVLHDDCKINTDWLDEFASARDGLIPLFINHTTFSPHMEPGDLVVWTAADIKTNLGIADFMDSPLSIVSLGLWAGEQYDVLNLLRALAIDPSSSGGDHKGRSSEITTFVADPSDPSRATWAKSKADYAGKTWASPPPAYDAYYAWSYHLVWYDEYGVPFLWEDTYHIEGVYGNDEFTFSALKVPAVLYAIYYVPTPAEMGSDLYQPIGDWPTDGLCYFVHSEEIGTGETTFDIKTFTQAEAEGHSFIDPDTVGAFGGSVKCLPSMLATVVYYNFEFRDW